MKLGVLREQAEDEKRIASTPATIKKYIAQGFTVFVEGGAGDAAFISDADFRDAGAELVERKAVLSCEIILSVNRIPEAELSSIPKGTVLLSMIEPFRDDGWLEKTATQGLSVFGMELIPRISRAQSMDVLSSQANIAGCRAVLEAVTHYPRFTAMMMTSAGSSKPAKVLVLGAGVAGLQAIATAKRLGAQVWSFDVRPEVREQIESLGAKFVEIDTGTEGRGEGGYAKELSEEGKKKLDAGLAAQIAKSDIIISTANIPGRKAPVLIPESAVKEMRAGSVIVDLAAVNGGNCPLTQKDQVVVKHNVTLVGHTNYPSMMASDASEFYGRNLMKLIELFAKSVDGKLKIDLDLDDEVIAGTLAADSGQVKFKRR